MNQDVPCNSFKTTPTENSDYLVKLISILLNCWNSLLEFLYLTPYLLNVPGTYLTITLDEPLIVNTIVIILTFM